MNFTYDSYLEMISLLRENNYNFVKYHSQEKFDKKVILRHDVDMDLKKAAEFAEFEKNIEVKSTYFLMLGSEFYNLFTRDSQQYLNKIINNGHSVGLHFDEERDIQSEDIVHDIEREIDIFEKVAGVVASTVSMHRPSKWTW